MLMRLTHLAGRAYDTSTNEDTSMLDVEFYSDATHTLFIREQTHSQDLTASNIDYYECKDGRVATHQDFRDSLGEVPVLAMAAKAFEEIADAFKYFSENGSEIRQVAFDLDTEADYICLKTMTEDDIFKYAQSEYQAKLALVWKQFFDAANHGLKQAGFDEFLQKTVPRSQFKIYTRMMRKVFPTNDARYDSESINRTWEGSTIEFEGTEYANAIAFIRSLTEQKVAEITDIREEILEHFEMILQEAAQNWANAEHRRELVLELFNVFSWFNGTLTKVEDKTTRDEIDVRPKNRISEEEYQEKEMLVAEMIATFIGVDVGANID